MMRCFFSILVFIAMLLASAEAQVFQSVEGEKQARQLQSSLDSLQTQQHHLLSEASILAQRIELYRSKPELNAKEHRNLEKLLRESQGLSSHIQSLADKINQNKQELQLAIEIVLEAIQKRMESIAILSSNPQISEEKKQQTVTQIQEMLQLKEVWENQYPAIDPVPQTNLNVPMNAWDSSRRLRMKGELLQDQEARYRKEVAQVQNRIDALRKEQMVRRQVQELTQDMNLFNEQEELLGRRETNALLSSNYYDFWGVENGVRETFEDGGGKQVNGPPQESSLGFAPPSFGPGDNATYEPHSLGALQTAIEQLDAYQKGMLSKADSLKQQAERFFKAAEAKNR